MADPTYLNAGLPQREDGPCPYGRKPPQGFDKHLARIVDGALQDLLTARKLANPEAATLLDGIARDLAATCGIYSSDDLGLWPDFPGWRRLALTREGAGYDELLWLARVLPAHAPQRSA